MDVRVVVAVQSRELKTAVFVAASGNPEVEIVAAATTTTELLTYARALRPAAVIVEPSLPGRPLAEVLPELTDLTERVFLVGKEKLSAEPGTKLVSFDEIDDLVGTMTTPGASPDRGGTT